MRDLNRPYPSLRAHLIAMLSVFAALFLGLTLYLYLTSRTLFAEALKRELSGDLEWMASLISSDPDLLAVPVRADSLCRAIARFKGFRVTMIDSAGQVRADSHVPLRETGALENHRQRPEIIEADAKVWGYAWRYSNTIGMEMLYVARRLPNQKGYLRIAAGPTALWSFQKASLRIFALFLGLFMSGSLAVTWWISRKISSPLLHLIGTGSRGPDSPTPRWEAEFREAEVLNQAFQGYVEEIRKLGGAVETERDKLVAIMNQLEEGIIILSDTGLVMAANPASIRLIGANTDASDQSRSTWLNRPATELIKHKALKDWIGRIKESDRPPFLHVDKGSEAEFDLLCHVTNLDTTSTPRECLLTLIDVTELRNLDRIKSEFVANASHELKTPLSSIKGYTETLLDGALEDAKVRELFVKKIHNNALRLELLILDLLSLSQLEAHPELKATEPLSLRVYVNAAANLHRHELDSSGIRLENQIPDSVMVVVEPRDLEHILNNLIGNAIRYNKPGGKVKVWVESGDSLQLSVKDTGIGIPEDMLPRIFERFYRAAKSRASKEGTGLGLAIVKHAANKYGMTVTVESVLDEGSRFQVNIPLGLVAGGVLDRALDSKQNT